MAIYDLYSKRQKRTRGEYPEVYQYDIPRGFRVQVVLILDETIGVSETDVFPYQTYHFVNKVLSKEYQVLTLGRENYMRTDVLDSFMNRFTDEYAIDFIELIFNYIDTELRHDNHYQGKLYNKQSGIMVSPDAAISELNQRFKENGIGFQYLNKEIFRIDSAYTHSEIVLPTLTLLNSKTFEGANDEYLKAHEHYRHGRNKECLAECLKAFESTLKIICKEKGWTYNENDTSRKLIQICFNNGLVPSFTQNQFTSLQNLLESGIPTLRNKLGGHGQGQTPLEVDDHIARYSLNLAGTNIIFLVEQSEVK